MTLTISAAFTVTVSSPKVTSWPVTAPGSAAATISPNVLRASLIRASPLDRPGTADLLLQQQHAVEQCLRRRRAARHVNVDRHDPIAATYDRIGIVIVAAAVGA